MNFLFKSQIKGIAIIIDDRTMYIQKMENILRCKKKKDLKGKTYEIYMHSSFLKAFLKRRRYI